MPPDPALETNPTTSSTSSRKLLIFARYPRLGTVKTRLAPLLDDSGCLGLHLSFLLDTIERTGQLGVERYLYLSGCSEGEARDFLSGHSLHSLPFGIQRGSDLGERMWNAYLSVQGSSDRVVFLGTDTPSLPLKHVRTAFQALENVPVVLGPVEDGGYFLIGLSEPRRELFFGIPWDSTEVFQTTLERLANTSYYLLPKWYDVDLEKDLIRLTADLGEDFEGFPERTRAFIGAWRIIKNT